MTTINCIAIEDEPHALRLLQHHASQVPFLNWMGGFRNPLQALPVLKSEPIHALFLDIDLPQLNGISFYRSLEHKPPVVFTTAYAEFAVESYEIEAIDYLIKPVVFERFLQACNKLLRHEQTAKGVAQDKATTSEALYVKSGSKWFHLNWADVLYLEKTENYVVFHTGDGRKILTRQTMGHVEQIVPSFFCRVHKSFIVNLKSIDVVERERVTINNKTIALADSYREIFMKKCGIGPASL